MKFAFYTISLSPHQLPLAKALMDVIGEDEYRYVSAKPVREERRKLGWSDDIDAKWYVKEWEKKAEAREILESSDVLMSGERDLSLMEKRCRNGLKTIYCAERWFKPWMGILRLLNPSYFRMARRFVKLLCDSESMYYFPMGIHAARDMARLCGLMHGDLRCLLRAPELGFERKPGGRMWLKSEPRNTPNARKYGLDKMRMWGYFVEKSDGVISEGSKGLKESKPSSNSHIPSLPHFSTIRVLWVGRLLDLKRVDTIVRAVIAHSELKRVYDSSPRMALDIYGAGPELNRLKKMVNGYGEIIKFHPPVPIAEVRKLMRSHDVYVLSSNSYEGWGAVVSEALEEGMRVVGTYEAGSSATTLPETCLFHAGNTKALLRLLQGDIPQVGIGAWTAKYAAAFLADAFFKHDSSVRSKVRDISLLSGVV